MQSSLQTAGFLLWLAWIPIHFGLGLSTAYGQSEAPANVEGATYYEQHIRPLFARHCYQCHSNRSKELQGGLRLDTREGWMQGGANGDIFNAADVNAGSLIRAIRYHDPALQMPPIAPLTAEDIGRIEHWVRMGAPGPSDGSVDLPEDPSDPVAGKNHWAYRDLVKQSTPDSLSGWSRTAIDGFIYSKLKSEGLRPVADATPIDLVRRLSFQLTGLPPTREDIEALQADASTEAIEQLVEKLLASPEYGRQWGRHWLDLARYADSNGLDENFLFREAWRYRNWVIDAINHDTPFDRFIIEQFAGDLLPFDSIEQRDQQRLAGGFLVIGPKVLLGNNPINQRMEIADEQLDTIGKALLGQTMGCARCHDHKFDPVPTSDYYAMAGIFASTSVMETRYMLGEQRVMEKLIGLGTDGKDLDEAYEAYWRQHPKLVAKKKDIEAALELLKQDTEEKNVAFKALLEKNPESIADIAKELDRNREERVAAQQALLADITKVLSQPPAIPPRGMIPEDVEQPSDEHIRLAGQFDRPGEKVPRGFLSVLSDENRTEIPSNRSGRLELSQWLVSPNTRAGQLVARVHANRVWHHLMGRGLVRTVDNFGRTGELPTHPELLDYLATRLIQSGWSTKALVREIVLSRTFGLNCDIDAQSMERDPDNRLYWRSNRRRLAPESFRDAMLVAADQIDLRPMNSTVSYLGDQATAVGDNKVRRRVDFPCRSVYLPVIRNDLPELFNVFDFANPHQTTGARPNTIVPMQGLFALNDDMMMDAAKQTAKRVLSNAPTTNDQARIDLMFELILNDKPDDNERNTIQTYLDQTHKYFVSTQSEEPELRTWTMLCHAMFASSRFQFLD